MKRYIWNREAARNAECPGRVSVPPYFGKGLPACVLQHLHHAHYQHGGIWLSIQVHVGKCAISESAREPAWTLCTCLKNLNMYGSDLPQLSTIQL